MALVFPLSMSSFFAPLRVVTSSFHAPATLAIGRTRGGSVTSARLAERLWTGQVTLRPERHASAAVIDARVSVLSEPGRSFFAHPLPLFAPIADPSGAALGAAAPQIHTLTSPRELRIGGLPAGYVLSDGDFIGFTYGSPVRYALHQIVIGAVAAGDGVTPNIEVSPPIRVGAATGAAIALVRPTIKAVLSPGAPGVARPRMSSGLTLDFIQTLG